MFEHLRFRHLPALFTAAAQCWATIFPIISGSTRNVMLHYGLDNRVADIPETWVVWHVGNARTACLGILMFIFYFQHRYDILDIFLIVSGGYLGLVDCYILCNQGLESMGVFRLLSSSVFAGLGAVGFTQGARS
ncbi:uncharacterized protein F4822DRAFT_191665 [Hypoxylon trugodes]|uniref:uncharacterized protein n=1 Tax=Hypoxylon trugodes TaxID=326681 RepID=UPI002197EA42|nr:uncharacterized protein F4822DRAFT_191665 [Hypoxylon trugodes]KAI1391626.1 hypothetical protein F4822DRAFT_191665 [Hypoxylon trugodes]